MSINNGTINALIQLNGGDFDSTKKLEEREPYITSNYYMYVGRGVEGNLPITPIKVEWADRAGRADSLVAGTATTGKVTIEDGVIKVADSITIRNKSIMSNTTGSSTLEGFNIKSDNITSASGTGAVSAMNLFSIKKIQLVEGESYGTELPKTNVQVGQLFFVVG